MILVESVILHHIYGCSLLIHGSIFSMNDLKMWSIRFPSITATSTGLLTEFTHVGPLWAEFLTSFFRFMLHLISGIKLIYFNQFCIKLEWCFKGAIYTFVELKHPFKAAAKYLQIEKATLAEIKSKDLICLLRILASTNFGIYLSITTSLSIWSVPIFLR